MVALKRTSTGILSNKRPLDGTPVASTSTSGQDTPTLTPSQRPLSLMSQAKRDAARRGLYSRFFRGPVIGPEVIAQEEARLAKLAEEAFNAQEVVRREIVAENAELEVRKKRKGKDPSHGVVGVTTATTALLISSADADEMTVVSRKRRRKEVNLEPVEQDIEEKERARREKKRRRREEKSRAKEASMQKERDREDREEHVMNPTECHEREEQKVAKMKKKENSQTIRVATQEAFVRDLNDKAVRKRREEERRLKDVPSPTQVQLATPLTRKAKKERKREDRSRES